MSFATHSLRHLEDDSGPQREYQNFLAEGYEPDLEGGVTGEQMELLLLYPSSQFDAISKKKTDMDRSFRSQKMRDPENITMLDGREAIVRAIIENPREANAQNVLWIDDVETKLRKALGVDKMEISKQKDLLEIIPSVGTWMDCYGADAFVLAWKKEHPEKARKFATIIERAKILRKYINKVEGLGQNADPEKEDLKMDIQDAISCLEEGVQTGDCAIATMDITLDSEKEYGTYDPSPNNTSTRADLLVDLRGGILHRDFQHDLEKRSGGAFETRVIQSIKRPSRRIFLAKALKLILEWKWESCRKLGTNLRAPGGVSASWIQQRKTHNQARHLLES